VPIAEDATPRWSNRNPPSRQRRILESSALHDLDAGAMMMNRVHDGLCRLALPLSALGVLSRHLDENAAHAQRLDRHDIVLAVYMRARSAPGHARRRPRIIPFSSILCALIGRPLRPTEIVRSAAIIMTGLDGAAINENRRIFMRAMRSSHRDVIVAPPTTTRRPCSRVHAVSIESAITARETSNTSCSCPSRSVADGDGAEHLRHRAACLMAASARWART